MSAADAPPVVALVGGGVRSGKSRFALELALARGERRVFVATARAGDDEMRERVARHVAERGDAFRTVEEPLDLPGALAALDPAATDVVVVDCVTFWLSNLLLADVPEAAIAERVAALAATLAGRRFDAVLVTNEVGMGVVPPSELGRRFRDVAGRAHQALAAAADEVYLAALGTILRIKPSTLTVDAAVPG